MQIHLITMSYNNKKEITRQITTGYDTIESLSNYLKDILQNETYNLYKVEYYDRYIIKIITISNVYNSYNEYVISTLSNLEKQQLHSLIKK